MPTYVYQCETCGQFEQWQSFKDSALTACPTCGSPVRRVITPAPIVFKGSGWYSTDSRSTQSKAITGGSAGGYTTLCALTFKDTFSAGASHYGVSDLQALDEDTHKFESRYTYGLVPKDQYQARSPIFHTDRLNTPVAFFQGLEDKIVPPNQAEKMVIALREKKLPVAYVTFEGEGHGFRQGENIKRALEGEFYFYSRIFGFTPADQLIPIDIENLD